MSDVTEGVKKFLSRLGLDRYYGMFIAKGFDSEGDISYLDQADLDAMYIIDESDRGTLLRSAASFKPSREYLLYEWLRTKGLEYYYISFVQSQLTDIAEIGRLNLPDEELYDELELTLPGHRRRLERAVRELCKKHRTLLPRFVETDLASQKAAGDSASLAPPEAEIPVAYGRWGKPRCLADAKYDFLIIDATVLSTIDARDKVDLEFMVDSGSDVVTIRQEVLDTMDLELIGPIQSKGVHASRRKNLYRANLQIGNQVLEIEVMGESYDSIGSRVIRHFRHFINGGRHVWLKGDFVDETSVSRPGPTTSVDTAVTVPEGSEATAADEIQDDIEVQSQESSPLAKHEDMEEGEVTLPAETPAEMKVQKDYVDIRKEQNGVDLPDHSSIEHIKVNFDFKKAEESVETVNKTDDKVDDHDETDKLMGASEESDIIDVRPIIAANRKRHANEMSGFDPSAHRLENVKKKKLHSDDNTIRTISTNGVLVCDMENLNVQTVMKKRSVYYRARSREEETEGS